MAKTNWQAGDTVQPGDMNDIGQEINQLRTDIDNIDVPPASLTQAGIVMLSNATNGTRENVAPTEKALSLVMQEAQAGKQAGIERKNEVVAALNSIGIPATTAESWDSLIAKMTSIIRATGNAGPAQVLSGYTFSNAGANGLNGAMPNRSAENQHMAGLETTTWPGDRVFIKPPAGYYDGASWVTAPAPNLRPENIVAGIDILGIIGAQTPQKYYEITQGTVLPNVVYPVNIPFPPKLIFIYSENDVRNTAFVNFWADLSGTDLQGKSWRAGKGDNSSLLILVDSTGNNFLDTRPLSVTRGFKSNAAQGNYVNVIFKAWG